MIPKRTNGSSMNKYMVFYTVLVRYHGVHIWGKIREMARPVCEYCDYWFINALSMKKMGVDLKKPPIRKRKKVKVYKPRRNVITESAKLLLK